MRESFLGEPAGEESEKASVQSPGVKEFKNSNHQQARAMLWKYFVTWLSARFHTWVRGEEVTIVPDGPLFLVPYASVTEQHSRYLSETIRVRLVPSPSSTKLMAMFLVGRHIISGALLVGDPWSAARKRTFSSFRVLKGTLRASRRFCGELNLSLEERRQRG